MAASPVCEPMTIKARNTRQLPSQFPIARDRHTLALLYLLFQLKVIHVYGDAIDYSFMNNHDNDYNMKPWPG
jgi:hypothetical protein